MQHSLCDRLFFEHPRSKGETYWQHFKAGSLLWVKMAGALMALGVHIFIPGFFQTTASSLLAKCHHDLATRGVSVDSTPQGVLHE